ncbi:unnamed protein product [Gordionus sp. m RMFG-2023]
MIENIYHGKSPFQQKFQFVLDIQKRGPLAFKCLIDALFITGQHSLANILCPREDQLMISQTKLTTTKFNSLLFYIEKERAILDLTLKSSEVLLDDDMYNMRVKHKGLAFIINNEHFEVNTNMVQRKGTVNDCLNLLNLFEKLGYTVIVKNNLNISKMREELDQFSKYMNHTSSCIVTILSHGINNKIYGTDGELLTLDYIASLFDGKRCPLLMGKPKIFILQTCRAENERNGLFHTELYKDMLKGDYADSKIEIEEESFTTSKYPGGMDMLFIYATLPGFMSCGNEFLGTWFIRTFVKVLAHHSHEYDILTMLTKVNEVISLSFESISGNKLMCEFISRLSKKFYFNNI